MSSTLSDLVTEDPRRARILEKSEIDYCCHGQRPLNEAASERGLDVGEVAAALDIAEALPASARPASAENAVLAHDIVDTHHAYMWQEMPRLQALVDKVARGLRRGRDGARPARAHPQGEQHSLPAHARARAALSAG